MNKVLKFHILFSVCFISAIVTPKEMKALSFAPQLLNVCLSFDQQGKATLSWNESLAMFTSGFTVTYNVSDMFYVVDVPRGRGSVEVGYGGHTFSPTNITPVKNYYVTITGYYRPTQQQTATSIPRIVLSGPIPTQFPFQTCVNEYSVRLVDNDCQNLKFVVKQDVDLGSHVRFRYRFDNVLEWTPRQHPTQYVKNAPLPFGIVSIDRTTKTAEIIIPLDDQARRFSRSIELEIMSGSLSEPLWMYPVNNPSNTTFPPSFLVFSSQFPVWNNLGKFSYNCSLSNNQSTRSNSQLNTQAVSAPGVVSVLPRGRRTVTFLAPLVNAASEYNIVVTDSQSVVVAEHYGRRVFTPTSLPSGRALSVRYRYLDRRTNAWTGFSSSNSVLLSQ